MTQVVEAEAKFEVSELDFHSLFERGRVVRRVDQLNIYFDDGWRLADAAATCRVRLSKGSAQLTLKLPAHWEDTTRIMLELDEKMDWLHLRRLRRSGVLRLGFSVSDHFPVEMQEALLGRGIRHLACVGWLRTSRYVVGIASLGELELDRVRLPYGRRVWEIEVEHAEASVRRQLIEAVRQWAPSARASTISKFERFRRALLDSSRVTSW